LTYPDGTRAWISTRTFKRVPMPLPAGWTRAASNAKFAFAVESRIGEDRNNYDVLKVQDLMTGVTQELYSLQSPPYSYTKMDVSSDGKLVSFGVRNNYGSAPEGWVRVQQVSDASKKTDITGALSGIAFKSGGDVSVTTLTSFANGTQLENAYTVKRSTMQSVLTNIKLVTKGTAVLAGGYLIIPVQNAYSNTYEVTLYDASAGGNHLVKLSAGLLYHASQAAGGSSGSGRYTMIDAYKTPSGKKLITVGISAVGNAGADYSQTFIIDPVTGVKLAINGAATAVKYSGFTALYTVRSGNGSTSRVSVNLKTLSVIG
jgi:hypothetical protein